MVRRTLAAVSAAFLLAPAGAHAGFAWFKSSALAPLQTAPVGSGPTFLFTGHGWGHGVGMSQYGALGYAQHGLTYTAILAHYYPGTTLGAAPLGRVRVLLVDGKKTLAVSSTDTFQVRDADGKTHDLDAGRFVLGPGLKLKAKGDDKPSALPPPLTFLPGTAPLALGDKAHRGQLVVSVTDGKLRAVNIVGLESYLSGVVPSEMPSSWLPEALKAQAVAARSYALSHLAVAGGFDLYDDVRSQVYGGLAAEKPSSSAAVAATAGQVLLYGGRVASTFFFSTSGGQTVAAADAWGEPVPYLVSVADPFDSISPYHDWGPVMFTGKRLGKLLKAPGQLLDVQTALNGSGRVASVTAIGTDGESTTAGGDARSKLGLRSTWFSVGVISLVPPVKPGPVTYGARAQLTGVARGVGDVQLQARPATAKLWQSLGVVKPATDGSLALAPKPLVGTSYRLATGQVAGAPVFVAVAPLVRLTQPASPTALAGVVRPVLPGVNVAVQRLDGARWRTVVVAPLDAQGAFTAKLRLVSGSYRARVSPGHGFAPGTSPALKVVSE